VIVQQINVPHGSESEVSAQDTSSEECLFVSYVFVTYLSFAAVHS